MSQPRVNIDRSADVAMVRGKPLLMYWRGIGIPSTGQITPEKIPQNIIV